MNDQLLTTEIKKSYSRWAKPVVITHIRTFCCPFLGALGIVLCHHLTKPAAGLASPNHCTGNMFFCGNAAGTAVEGGFN